MDFGVFETFRLTAAYTLHDDMEVVWQGSMEDAEHLADGDVCWRLDASLKPGYTLKELPEGFNLNACGPSATSLLNDKKLAKSFDGYPRFDYLRRNPDGSWSIGLDGVLFHGTTPGKCVDIALEAIKDW